MSDLAVIGFEVDTSEIEAATDALERLARAAERAYAAMEKLGGTPVMLRRIGDVETMKIGVQ